MKKLSLKNFLKYTLACLCAVCATIAGVFAIGANTAKAEEITEAPTISGLAFNAENETIKTATTISSNLRNLLDYTSDSPEFENFQTGGTYVIGDMWSKNVYYIAFNYSSNIEDYGKVLSSENNTIWYGIKDNLTVSNLPVTPQEASFTTFANGNSMLAITLPVSKIDTTKTYYYWFNIIKFSEVNHIDKVIEKQGVPVVSDSHIYYKSTTYSFSDYKQINVKDEAQKQLKTANNETNLTLNNNLLKYAGYNHKANDDITINVSYKQLKDFAQVQTVVEQFTIKGWTILRENYIKNTMYNVLGKTAISDFNAIYTDSYMIDGSIYDTQTRVFLQAESLSYSFDASSSVGTITVNYAPFKYSNFVIRITNNDPENNLTIDYFTADVVDNGESTTLTYNFETIERQLYNSAKWLFDIQKEDLAIVSAPNVTTSLSNSALTITFDNAYENNLSELSVKIVTQIMEDYELNVSYAYASVDNNLETTYINTEPVKMYYSKLVQLGNENFKTLEETELIYLEVIASISPAVLNGQAYYTYDGIIKDYNEDKTACTIIVEYSYTTLLKVTDSLASKTVYIALNSNSLTYDYEDLPFNVSNGYRIKNVTSDGNVSISFNEHTPEDLTITINENTAQKKIITLTAELTDVWFVKINYLERYKLTPFAEYKTATKEVRVSEYGEIKNITADQTASIIGKSTLNVLKSTVESLDVRYDGKSTYTITPKYTYLSLKAIDYNGNSKEIKVPLTCYEDYCDMFGQDWSILWLNSSETQHFEYSNSVARDKLYGYFNVAVFEEQVSDLNYFFKSNTGDGCMTIFKSQQVQGDKVYQFANDMRESLLFGGVGYSLMAFCEITNDSNNILESYFFYLDINSDKPYLSTGGADNAEDEDSAGENLGEDVIEGIKDNVDSIGNDIEDWLNNNPFAQFLKILGYVLIGGLALFLLVWVFRKIK